MTRRERASVTLAEPAAAPDPARRQAFRERPLTERAGQVSGTLRLLELEVADEKPPQRGIPAADAGDKEF